MSTIYKFNDLQVFNDLLNAISHRFNNSHKIQSDNILLLVLTYNNITKEAFDSIPDKNKLFFINTFALDTITKLLQINIVIRDDGVNYTYYSNHITSDDIFLLKISLHGEDYLYYRDEHDNVCYDGIIIDDDIGDDNNIPNDDDIPNDDNNIVDDISFINNDTHSCHDLSFDNSFSFDNNFSFDEDISGYNDVSGDNTSGDDNMSGDDVMSDDDMSDDDMSDDDMSDDDMSGDDDMPGDDDMQCDKDTSGYTIYDNDGNIILTKEECNSLLSMLFN